MTGERIRAGQICGVIVVTGIDRIVVLARQRQQILSAELRLGNQVKALERQQTGQLKGKRKVVMTPSQIAVAGKVVAKVNPLLQPLEVGLRRERRKIEKELEAAAQALPIWSWAQGVRGIGPLGLALVVGQAGDLSSYSGPSKLWKRMGLAVIDGERQRRIAGTTKAKCLEAERHGFNPTRRALAFVLSESLLKQNKGEYRALYDARKALELDKVPTDAKGRRAWAHRRALRYMVKRFFLHLWCVWNGQALTNEQTAA